MPTVAALLALCPLLGDPRLGVCSNFYCHTKSNKHGIMCTGTNVVVSQTTVFKTCEAPAVELGERFGRDTELKLQKKNVRCDASVSKLVYFPAGMLDEWNPYEGLHQHTAAFMTARALGISLSGASVGFRGSVSMHRGFPLYGLWNLTFDRVLIDKSVCAKRVIIPVSSERSFNTFHQPTCHSPELLSGYRQWLLSFLKVSVQPGCYAVVVIKRPVTLRRHEQNIDEFVSHLSLMRRKGKPVCVKAMTPHELDVKTQLETIASSQMLIGTHGGALTWLVVLPRGGVVVELSANKPHYKHWANALQVEYQSVPVGIVWGTQKYRIDVKAIAKAIGFE